MRGTIKASSPSVGRRISFSGTPVEAGDLVVADDDGVLVIPAEHALRTICDGQARADKEATMMNELREGRSTLELMGLTSWRETR